MELVAPLDWYHVTTLQEVDGVEIGSIFLISRLTTLLAFSTQARIQSVRLVARTGDDEWRMVQLAQIWKATDSKTGNSVTVHHLVGGEKRVSGDALQVEDLIDLEMLLDIRS